MKKYDYCIVGAGLFGSVFAYEATQRGKTCLIIEKRDHIGGNIYCENINEINVHKYGAHIFHTNEKRIWDYVNQFVEFNNFINSPIANYKGEIYNLPFNMNTFNKLWGVISPEEARDVIEKQKIMAGIVDPKNLEEQAISLVGVDIYQKLIKGYTEKQWGKPATELPAFIIKRVPVRFRYDNNYFNDKYQGIPIGGYNVIIKNMLKDSDIELNTDYFKDPSKYSSISNKIVFTGMLDEYFNYKFGELEYRSLHFESEKLIGVKDYQGNAVVNYTDSETPYTRSIEHKHFEFGDQEDTIITKEYPVKWEKGKEAYYSINDIKNSELYLRYKELSYTEQNVIFGGRLADYKYYDMDKIIDLALKKVEEEFN